MTNINIVDIKLDVDDLEREKIGIMSYEKDCVTRCTFCKSCCGGISKCKMAFNILSIRIANVIFYVVTIIRTLY